MIYRHHRPRPPLSDFVELLWLFERPTPPHGSERVLPTGTIELVINLGDSDCSFDAVVAGPHSRYFVLDTRQPTAVIGAHFKPGGAFAFLDVPGDELHNSHVPLDALWGPRVAFIRERLLAVADPDGRLRLLERLLLAQLDRERSSHSAVSHALRAFRSGRRRIGDVVEETGLSPRRFIRLFSDEVGLTPKAYCRVMRFQHTVSRLHGLSEVDWADTATACGYYDQAHMIHDFREFAGLNPTAYLARRTFMNHVPQ
jgi:AraC-like DNA-binding protein